MITADDITNLIPKARPDIADRLAASFDLLAEDYEINNPLRLSHFFGQIAHESTGFRVMEENLNYSADRLLVIFPKYFTQSSAKACARNPEKIANTAYANRMGNGNSASGDGYMFRGRGLIQLTGRDNYTAFADSCDMTPEEAVEYLSTAEGAIDSAAWFWGSRKINRAADNDDYKLVTKLINGGQIGLAERIKYTDMFKELFGA